jgi:hypothetical protein
VWWIASWIAGRLRPVVEVDVVEVRVGQQGGDRGWVFVLMRREL